MIGTFSASRRLYPKPTPSFVRLAKHHAYRRITWRARLGQLRWQSTAATAPSISPDYLPPSPEQRSNNSLAISGEEPEFNDVGVQRISSFISQQIFPNGTQSPPPDLVQFARDHLRRHDLLDKNTDRTEPIAFELPPIQGSTGTFDEHFHRLGIDCAEPYLEKAKRFAGSQAPSRPRKWIIQSGWTKYITGKPPKKVAAPDDDLLCFDTEVLYKESNFAVMACAASPTAWYAWLSPWLLGESESDRHLVPLGDPTKHRVIVGHNVGYDRARVLEEYDLKQTKNAFLDTMSLHVAVNGMCSQQRPRWTKTKKVREAREKLETTTDEAAVAELMKAMSDYDEEDEPWIDRCSVNSLLHVAKFHLDIAVDKTARDDFGTLSRAEIVENCQKLLTYCATDVETTHGIFKTVFPTFLNVCPHPVSFAALRHLSSVILPVDRSWDAYIANADDTYMRLSRAIQERLIHLAEKALEIKADNDVWSKDPWLRQLDWSGQEIKMAKGKRKGDPPRPTARQKKPGMPLWYKDLFTSNDSPINLTVRTRVVPLLLRLAWEGHPLFWSHQHGWLFRAPLKDAVSYANRQMIMCVFADEKDAALRDDEEGIFFKLPHKDGPSARCVNPMAKGYLMYFENGTLSSEYTYAKEALEMNASCSYWISARARIMNQMVVYQGDLTAPDVLPNSASHSHPRTHAPPRPDELGFILPQIIPMGTITRRAVERTWLTASNAKKNRVGSELKSMVKAPPGYSFVGADVDSEELWIASLVGDAMFQIHGGNALGFMTLEGTKAAGTDLHSRTASILGITRNDAKVFNYGRIYGAGLKFAATLLRQFNPLLPEAEATETASKLYSNTKGTKTGRRVLYKRPFWRGGTESFVFNMLEEFAEQEHARTPVLGAGITEALMSRNIKKGGYLTSRINWAIQSSGVDYLHLLIVSMDYLIRRYSIDARLAITVHDEIRYLVKNADKYRAAMALQVANLWTRAMFSQQVGIEDLPQSCAFFSAVDIDHVLRKEVDMPCITPTNKEPIPPGESLDIMTLLSKGKEAYLDPAIVPDASVAPRLDGIAYRPRKSVMKELENPIAGNVNFLKAQIISDEKELATLVKEARRSQYETAKGAGGMFGRRQPSRENFVAYHSEPHLLPTNEPVWVSEAIIPPKHATRHSTGQWVLENCIAGEPPSLWRKDI